MKKPFEPNFYTPEPEYSKEEQNKIAHGGIQGNLKEDFGDASRDDIAWETEQLAKSHGIYLEFNRAKTGREKDWMYMVRISIPGGGPLTREQWRVIDELSDKYTVDPDGRPSIRLTTRQNIQYHWIPKKGVPDLIKSLAESGLNTLNGCGDNTRNVMGCPLSFKSNVFNGAEWAHKAGAYFQLPLGPFLSVWQIDPAHVRKPEQSYSYPARLLNRKFKIGFSSVHKDQNGNLYPDNCIEVRTNDMGVVPIIENNQISRFQIYIGGSQGERNGKPSIACLGEPLCITDEANLLRVMEAVVKVHEEAGDRQNRFWARLKYTVKKNGVAWFRDRVSAKLGEPLTLPREDLDPGPRHLHHGWTQQPADGLWAFGLYVENGRLIDGAPNGDLKKAFRTIMEKYDTRIMITPNQDALFLNIPENQKQAFEDDLNAFGVFMRNGKPFSRLRRNSGACVGRDTCRLTYTDSEKFEPELLDELDKLGWGDLNESIGITGCERQCFRPSTKTIGLIGTGLDRYQLRLGGSEDARFQGKPLLSPDGEQMYLRMVPRDQIPTLLDTLFKFYKANAADGEDLGAFNRRIGTAALIAHLKSTPATAELLEKTFPTDTVIE